MPQELFIETALRRLKEHGHRITPARRRVLHTLWASQQPISLQGILAQLNDAEPPFNRITLHRTLELLCAAGVVHRLSFSGGYLPCVLSDASGCHHHLVCRSCGQVQEFPCQAMATVERQAAAASGYRIERHLLEFVDLCPACQ